MPNRIKKAQELFLLWRNYLSDNKKESRQDFYTWIATTYFRKSLYAMELPWLSFNAQRYLQKIISPDMKVFEWGSGSSTLFWCKNNCHVVSIEYDPVFYLFLQKKLKNNDYSVEYRLIQPEDQTFSSSQNMDIYISMANDFKDKTFFNYATVIDEYPDNSFDIIMIDGRVRLTCFLKAINKIKVGGTIIFDNSNMLEYSILDRFIPQNWKSTIKSGPTPANIYPVVSYTSFITRGEV
jgi:hypothetical protein